MHGCAEQFEGLDRVEKASLMDELNLMLKDKDDVLDAQERVDSVTPGTGFVQDQPGSTDLGVRKGEFFDEAAKVAKQKDIKPGDMVALPADEFGRRVIKIVPNSYVASLYVAARGCDRYEGEVPRSGYIIDLDAVRERAREVEYDEGIDRRVQRTYGQVASGKVPEILDAESQMLARGFKTKTESKHDFDMAWARASLMDVKQKERVIPEPVQPSAQSNGWLQKLFARLRARKGR